MTQPGEELTIRLDLLIDAPVERVWSFLASEDGMRAWQGAWRFEPRLGGETLFYINFETGSIEPDGAAYRMTGRVTVFEPPRRLAFTWRQEDLNSGVAWPEDTLIAFRLEPEGAGTRVYLEHSGFERLPAEYARSMYEDYSQGWLHHGSLAQLAELVAAGGVGNPAEAPAAAPANSTEEPGAE